MASPTSNQPSPQEPHAGPTLPATTWTPLWLRVAQQAPTTAAERSEHRIHIPVTDLPVYPHDGVDTGSPETRSSNEDTATKTAIPTQTAIFLRLLPEPGRPKRLPRLTCATEDIKITKAFFKLLSQRTSNLRGRVTRLNANAIVHDTLLGRIVSREAIHARHRFKILEELKEGVDRTEKIWDGMEGLVKRVARIEMLERERKEKATKGKAADGASAERMEEDSEEEWFDRKAGRVFSTLENEAASTSSPDSGIESGSGSDTCYEQFRFHEWKQRRAARERTRPTKRQSMQARADSAQDGYAADTE